MHVEKRRQAVEGRHGAREEGGLIGWENNEMCGDRRKRKREERKRKGTTMT